MRVVTVTTFYPNSAAPMRTVFVENLVCAMRENCDISVVAPVPYAPPIRKIPRWHVQSQIASIEYRRGIRVLHPRYLVVPNVDSLSGLTYCFAILPVLRRLAREGTWPVIHVHCAYPDAVGVAIAARILGVQYVVTAHGSDINVYSEHRTLRSQIRWALRGASGVIAVSADLKEKIDRLTKGAVQRLEHLPCAGFDPEKFFPRPSAEARVELGVEATSRVVVFVGNLVSIKGVEFLIDAWDLLAQRRFIDPNDRLLLIGKGPCREDLECRVAARGLGSTVRFLGEVSQVDVSRWVSCATLLCLPSRNEGTPNVVVEALACGVPVVATRVGGVPDLVRDGINGQLVPAGDASALADALAKVMSVAWNKESICATVSELTWRRLGVRNCEFLEAATGSGAPDRSGPRQ